MPVGRLGRMTERGPSCRWNQSEFVRAWEAGAFDHRVELIDGEIRPVMIGSRRGETVGQIVASPPRSGMRVTTSTLPTGESLPDPDCWVRRADAKPIGTLGTKLSVWNADDVLLVIEVADETTIQDLTVKAALYGRAGYSVCWVVTPRVIYEHTGPISTGYRTRIAYRSGDRIPVRYAATDLAVDDLIDLPSA